MVIGAMKNSMTGQGFRLSVDGTTYAREVWATNDNWSDYVFDDLYDLMQLHDLDRFFGTHGHLPNIPSSADVAKKGYGLNEMNAMLLQKIEELTLYIIALKKELDNVKSNP